MRVKPPERAFSFSPKGNEVINLAQAMEKPVRFDILFERGGYHYYTAKALIVEKDTFTLWEKGEKRVKTLKQVYERLYRQFGRGIKLVPVPV
jgi:hypothetical protein